MVPAGKVEAVEEKPARGIGQVFDMHEELADALLHVVLAIQKRAHARDKKHGHIQRIVPELHEVVRVDRDMLQAALLRARQALDGVLSPLPAKRQIAFLPRLLIQIRQRQKRAHAVDVLLRRTGGDMLVKPAGQIAQHGFVAGVAVIFIQPEKRHALKPVPVFHEVLPASAGEDRRVFGGGNPFDDLLNFRAERAPRQIHRSSSRPSKRSVNVSSIGVCAVIATKKDFSSPCRLLRIFSPKLCFQQPPSMRSFV